jgi:hypothetical protein
MNYADELQLQINEIHRALVRVGWLAAARSVEAAAVSAAGIPGLLAAHDHACWHMQQLENQGLRQANQYDRDCY